MTITNDASIDIPSEPGRYLNLTVKAGAGRRGEGKFGGNGGTGEIKSLKLSKAKDLKIQVMFISASKDGEDSVPVIIKEQEYYEANKGGKAGKSVAVRISTESSSTTLYCAGGGGGGGGGYAIAYDGRMIFFDGGNGGCSETNPSSNAAIGINGGRGTDGDKNAYVNQYENVICENPVNSGNAEVIIEDL